MVHVLTEKNSLVSVFLNQLRDIDIQKESMRFRRNLERISEIFAYEISKQLNYEAIEVNTPLGVAKSVRIADKIVIANILRAGIPMHTGFLNYFDEAENAFISAFRKYHKDNSFEIKFEYLSSPEIEGKVLILVDPMLATGASMVVAYKGLIERGIPLHTHFVSIIAAKEGIEYLQNNIDHKNISVWTAAIDDELTAKGYIVPGLGDAGDLAFGNKL